MSALRTKHYSFSGMILDGEISVFIFKGRCVIAPVNKNMLRINNRHTRKRGEVCSKLTIKPPEQRQCCCFGILIVNFEHTLYLFLVFVLLNLSMKLFAKVNVVFSTNCE